MTKPGSVLLAPFSALLKAPSFFPSESVRPSIADYKVIVDRFLAHAIYWALLLAAFYGLAAGARLGVTYPGEPLRMTFASSFVGLMLALAFSGAAIALGAFVGFLFGLPRSLTSAEVREGSRLVTNATNAPDRSGSNRDMDEATATSDRVPGYGTNSNLERISDWLTTILVGLGLMQLQTILPAIEEFGERAGTFFLTGGKLFAISAGLYFLITGFLLSYMNTRTKIVLIFTENDIDARNLSMRKAYEPMYNINPVMPLAPKKDGSPGIREQSAVGGKEAEPPNPEATLVKDAAQALAQKSAVEARTPQELLAIANARALTGDYKGALSFYRDVYKRADHTLSNDDLSKFAGVIGLNGDTDVLDQLLAALRFKGQDAIAGTIGANFDEGLKTALEANLYNGGFEESIRLGRIYFSRNAGKSDCWAHLWMACALGQKHAAVHALDNADPSLESLCNEAAEEARQAIADEPTLASHVLQLAYPPVGASDNDLATVASCLVAKGVIPAQADLDARPKA